MNIFDVISLLGGLAMFLYGMRLMGDSLKENSSGTLKIAIEKVTNNPVKAFILGVLITALIQSSTATIVITSGLVGAGILTLRQSLGIIVGANVGTTVTGQIIRLLDLNASGGTSWLRFFQPSTLAPLALILGMVLIMGNFLKNSRSIGNIAVGFGVLFSGLLNMTSAVNTLASSGMIEHMFLRLGDNPLLGYVTGAGVAFVLQSSSAAVGILQAFSATGLLAFKSIYAVIVGIYLGDCVTTAIVCSIGAKADAKRVGIMNILFNLSKSALVLIVVTVIHRMGLLDGLWDATVNSGIIANTNTVFNLGCSVLLFPLLRTYEALSIRMVKDEAVPEDRYKEAVDALSPVFFNTPALALQSCYNLLNTLFGLSRGNISKAFSLLRQFDDNVYAEMLADEKDIDRLTDQISRYIVGLLPHLQLEDHVAILDQYYKVTAEFERLGDHALNIAANAAALRENGAEISAAALSELKIIEDATNDILDETQLTFSKRDVEASKRIEPLVQVISELTSQLKQNHLLRMSRGECNIIADSSFTDLMVEFVRIAGICSNVGIATAVRVNPELADHEHLYYERLHSGGDEEFNALYETASKKYFGMLKG